MRRSLYAEDSLAFKIRQQNMAEVGKEERIYKFVLWLMIHQQNDLFEVAAL